MLRLSSPSPSPRCSWRPAPLMPSPGLTDTDPVTEAAATSSDRRAARASRHSPHPARTSPSRTSRGSSTIGKVRYAISQWFSNLVTSALRPVFDFLGHTVFSTPPLADNDRIVQLWGFSLAIADSLLLLLLLVGAGLVTVGGGLGSQLTARAPPKARGRRRHGERQPPAAPPADRARTPCQPLCSGRRSNRAT